MKPHIQREETLGRSIVKSVMSKILKRLIKQIITEELTKEKLKSYFHAYVTDNDSQDIEDNIDDILNASKKGKYGDILETDFEYAYRIIDFRTTAQVEKILSLNLDDVDKTKYHTVKNVKLSPAHGNVSSWTSNPRSLIFSGFLDVAENNNLIVLKTKISKNKFFGNPDTLAFYAGEDIGYSLERETVGFGPVDCEKAVFGFKQKDQSLEGLALDLINKLSELNDLDFTSDYYLPKKYKLNK